MKKKIFFSFLLILLGGFLTVQSVKKSSKLNEWSDFNVFRKAGLNFNHGDDLYDNMDKTRPFVYPPTAAFIFQVFSIFPMKTSALIFNLVNIFIFYPFAVYLIAGILINAGFNKKFIKIPIILAAVCSLKFFMSNIMLFQVNFAVFLLCLAGFYYLSGSRPHIAMIFFVAGAFIKVYPVIFIIFTFIYYKQARALLFMIFTVVIFLAVPALQRGSENFYRDHQRYYDTFLGEFSQGKVLTSYTNHTAKSFVLKAFHPETRDRDTDSSFYGTDMLLTNIVLLLMLAMIFINSFFDIRNNKKISIFNLAAIYIFIHLVSGITWTAHLVTALFFYLPLFLIDIRLLNKPMKVFHIFLAAAAFFLAIEGSDTTGKALYHLIRYYDVLALFPFILFIYYSFIIISGKEHDLTLKYR